MRATTFNHSDIFSEDQHVSQENIRIRQMTSTELHMNFSIRSKNNLLFHKSEIKIWLHTSLCQNGPDLPRSSPIQAENLGQMNV